MLVALLFAATLLAGCATGDHDACVPDTEETPDAPLGLVTLPEIYGRDGWAVLVNCNEDPGPLGQHRFEIATGEGRTLVVDPQEDWQGTETFYAGTNGTEPDAQINATKENPGNGGDPTYRIQIMDQNENGVFDANDEVHLTYDAGAVGTTTFESPLEEGIYRLSVFDSQANVLLGFARRTMEGRL